MLSPSVTFHKCPKISNPSFSSPSRKTNANDSAVIVDRAVALCRLKGLKLLQDFRTVEFTLDVLQTVWRQSPPWTNRNNAALRTQLSVFYRTTLYTVPCLIPALYDPPINTQNLVIYERSAPGSHNAPVRSNRVPSTISPEDMQISEVVT